MIRNVCIHVEREQPLLCDLFQLPTAGDAGLLCTNVRSLDGKRPVFIDQIASTFFFPYHTVRFLEIPEPSMVAYRASGGRASGAGAPVVDGPGADPFDAADDPETMVSDGDSSMVPIAVGAPGEGDETADADLEIDEDFLRRVRDI